MIVGDSDGNRHDADRAVDDPDDGHHAFREQRAKRLEPLDQGSLDAEGVG
jgi:hypothetical protein